MILEAPSDQFCFNVIPVDRSLDFSYIIGYKSSALACSAEIIMALSISTTRVDFIPCRPDRSAGWISFGTGRYLFANLWWGNDFNAADF